jgi:hypothetical protein
MVSRLIHPAADLPQKRPDRQRFQDAQGGCKMHTVISIPALLAAVVLPTATASAAEPLFFSDASLASRQPSGLHLVRRWLQHPACALFLPAGNHCPYSSVRTIFRTRETAVEMNIRRHGHDRTHRGCIGSRGNPDLAAASAGRCIHRILDGILGIEPGRSITRARAARHDIINTPPPSQFPAAPSNTLPIKGSF